MSRENVEAFRRGWEHFRATGDLLAEIIHPDFVWDMSTFRRGLVIRQTNFTDRGEALEAAGLEE